MRCRRSASDDGSAVVDFVLVSVVLIPLVLGIAHLALVLHVRNTLTSAASEAARHGARADADLDDAERHARDQIAEAIAGRYTSDITASTTQIDGAAAVRVEVHAEVPALGLFGPAVVIDVEGHAIEEEPLGAQPMDARP